LGFSVLPGGIGDSSSYVGKGYNANFWTALSYSNRESYSVYISYNNAVAFSIDDKGFFESVRCLKGKPVGASSSSSSAVSSSSEAIPISVLCKTEVVDACEYGTLTDDRDGQTYKTVKIGDQVWMAENLNYENGNSMCYSDDTTKCSKSGRIYTWDAAKEVCPSGWHLPDSLEWEALFSAVGTRGMAGRNLKSTTGWANNGNGVDAYGFSVLPIAFWDVSEFIARDEYAKFWSSTEVGADKAELQDFYMSYDSVLHGSFSKKMALSVRCLKD
jgi:uncharacterized protein (TIGR02145 family)